MKNWGKNYNLLKNDFSNYIDDHGNMNEGYVGDEDDKNSSHILNIFYVVHVYYSILIKLYDRAPLLSQFYKRVTWHHSKYMAKPSQGLRYALYKIFILNHPTVLHNQECSNPFNKYTIWYLCNIYLFQKLLELLINCLALIDSTFREVVSDNSEM